MQNKDILLCLKIITLHVKMKPTRVMKHFSIFCSGVKNLSKIISVKNYLLILSKILCHHFLPSNLSYLKIPNSKYIL